ncbi:xanthine dehydrogenase family protein molybdopterin-binding subunit [Agrobacterium rhizogenes]|nr:xanthine dehydrogenase family protein molybdopterin-binding subunit [Rhizobium rhizogenes]
MLDTPSTDAIQLDRRRFIQCTALMAGGFMLALSSSVKAAKLIGAATTRTPAGEVALNAWVRVQSDNTVTVIVSQAEIGQGISTTLPAVLVDELGADWSNVRLETAPYDPAYANPLFKWMFTGNSMSIQVFYDIMRTVGASAREMLMAAASQAWGLPASELAAEKSFIVHASSGKRATFGELAAAAAKITPPEKPKLKQDAELQLVGREVPRVDVPAKVDGSAVFGIDFRVPGMLNAAVRTGAAFGSVLDLNNRDALLRMPGVVAVVPVEGGFAVVADTYWHARSAMLKAETSIHEPASSTAKANTPALGTEYKARLDTGPFATAVDEGQAPARIAASKKTVEQDYENPFLAHATMEPMNAVAHVTDDHCVVWAPTAGQNLAWYALQAALGLKGEQVEVNRTPYMGGAFGRRSLADFIVQAALISKAVKAPVKVLWDREEDMRRDGYRPATMVKLTAALEPNGLPEAIVARVVSPTIISLCNPMMIDEIKKTHIDPFCIEGMKETPYAIDHRQVDFHLLETDVPTSVMRTTGYGPNIFAFESFIDELAGLAKQDPYAYRRQLLRSNAKALKVLDRAAELSSWNQPLAKGHGRGLAFALAFGTLIAQVIEVHVRGNEVKVERVTSVADPGRVFDPGIARANIEGGTVFGLAGCKSEVTFADGAVRQTNFDTYAMPYLGECPELVTEFIESGGPLGAMGEVSPVVTAPALVNAIFAASGKRLRAMPLSRNNLQFA